MQGSDPIGRIDFQAPDEGTGTDAILVAARIQAVSEGDFAADANATSLEFGVSSSGAPTTSLSLKSDGRGLSNYTAKAWGRFDGTGTPSFWGTPHNLSGITDHGTGDFTISFSNDMANSNYAYSYFTGDTGVLTAINRMLSVANGNIRFETIEASNSGNTASPSQGQHHSFILFAN